MNLISEWQLFLGKFTTDKDLIATLWNEITLAYNGPSRHYHSLEHLEFMMTLALENKADVMDFNTLQFSIFYHDIVYKAHKKDNEERSADVAKNRLESLGVEHEIIQKCVDQILATKSHECGQDSDTQFLLDIDLAILGQDIDVYKKYVVNVRKEYMIYPDDLYYPGRRKVLEHFLKMKSIYKTTRFQSLLEQQAKSNLKFELDSIQ